MPKTIEIECSPLALFALFDSSTISEGVIHKAPGGATLQLGRMSIEKRHVPGVERLVSIAVTFASGAAVNLFSNWLYDKLKGNERMRTLRINHVQVELTPEAITKLIAESIELQGQG